MEMHSSPAKRRYSKEDFAARGDEIYTKEVRPRLTAEDDGKFAAIDIQSGLFEVGIEELAACDRLRARAPDAQIWLVKIGSPYLHRFGGRAKRESP
jgi:hypothetical protein